MIFILTSKKFKKLVIEIMTQFTYDNFNILMRQYIKNLIVKIKQAIWLLDMSLASIRLYERGQLL